jgi:hypothetical protein
LCFGLTKKNDRENAMAMLPRAIRAFECFRPIDIYRGIGRRPSGVWVDMSGNIATAGPGRQQLKEPVYWHTTLQPGDQLQERVGGLFMVTPAGACHPVTLCPPHALTPDSAFTSAQIARNEDAARIDALLADGSIIPASGYRVMHYPSRTGERAVAADHPLVVEERPAEFDDSPVMPARRARGGMQ